MFRLVVIHQLVLSLLVGPMLCCCTVARVGHDGNPTSQTTTPADPVKSHSCCGHGQKPSERSSQKSGGERPDSPTKCPCKDAPAKAATVTKATPGSADSMGHLSVGVATLVPRAKFDARCGMARLSARFECRSSSLSTVDLLYAHHNLRC